MRMRMLLVGMGGIIIGATTTLLLAAGPATRSNWEYKFVNAVPSDGSFANSLGADGWELVSVSAPDIHREAGFYFKRPR